MPKEKKKKSTIKNNEPKFQINQNLLENRGVSFQYMIASRLQEIGKVAEKDMMNIKLSELLLPKIKIIVLKSGHEKNAILF